MNERQKKILLVTKKDLVITWFSGGGGAGGQHKNRHNNCCRIHHPASGATGQATGQRSASQNQKDAFTSMCDKPLFKTWLARVLLEVRTMETEEERIDRLMAPEFCKVEILRDGQWVEVSMDYFEVNNV